MGSSIKVGNYCLDEAFNDQDSLVYKFVSEMRRQGQGAFDGFDVLVGTGFSGALVVPVLAKALGKDYIIVRKPGDSHHHGNAIAEGSWNTSGKWLFVDDGIGTGTTYRRIRKSVNQVALENRTPDLFHGVYLYGHGDLHGPQFIDGARADHEFGERSRRIFGDWSLDNSNDPLRPVTDNGPGNWSFR